MSDKCTVSEDGKFVNPCATLEKSTEFGNPRGKQKGVWCWQYYGFKKQGPTRRFFGVKSGDLVESGIAFNFCPFCGVDISSPFVDQKPRDDNE